MTKKPSFRSHFLLEKEMNHNLESSDLGGIFFLPKTCGNDSQFEEPIFKMRWFNHQLLKNPSTSEVYVCFDHGKKDQLLEKGDSLIYLETIIFR